MIRKIEILILLFFLNSINAIAQTFNIFGCNPKYQTLSLYSYNNKLIYTSGVDSLCNIPINSIGIWNNNNWSTYGTGIPLNTGGAIVALCQKDDTLFVGGNFRTIGGIIVNNIAYWDGLKWNSLGSGLNVQTVSFVNNLVFFKGELYAAGRFNEINGLKNVHNIARWDGTTWKRVGTGLQGSFNEVYSMAVYKNELYVGGGFSDAGGITAYNIAKWNGTTWSTVGLGTNEAVMKLYVDTIRNLLYVGGGFSAVNNNTLASCIASWDGTNWSAMGNKTFTIDVSSMEMYHGYLYAGGLKFTDTCFAR